MKKSMPPGAATADRTRFERIPSLQLWRGERPPRLDAADIALLRATLAKLYLLAHPTWPDAIAGDVSAAARIALTIRYDLTSPTWLIDCAGSLILLCALEGSDTAALVLEHLRERYVVPARCWPKRSA